MPKHKLKHILDSKNYVEVKDNIEEEMTGRSFYLANTNITVNNKSTYCQGGFVTGSAFSLFNLNIFPSSTTTKSSMSHILDYMTWLTFK